MAADLAGMAFIPYYKHLMGILNTSEELRKTARGILQQVAWAAGGTAIGGVVAGPVGAMVGGLAGLGLGYRYSIDYDSLVAVIRNLNDDQKEQIVHNVGVLVGDATLDTLADFITTQENRKALLELLRNFATRVEG